MSTKISPELSQRLSELKAEGAAASETELPVIVTIKEASDLTALKERGFKLDRAYENISAVSGTLPAAAVMPTAQLDEVEHIDYDGEVHALTQDVDE